MTEAAGAGLSAIIGHGFVIRQVTQLCCGDDLMITQPPRSLVVVTSGSETLCLHRSYCTPQPRQVDDGRWSAPLFFRVAGIAEGLPASGSVNDSVLLLSSEEVADIWLKDEARPLRSNRCTACCSETMPRGANTGGLAMLDTSKAEEHIAVEAGAAALGLETRKN